MKKALLFVALLLVSGTISAQGYMVVNSENIFKSIPLYNESLKSLETLTSVQQQNIDAEYEAIEKMYNEYQLQKQYLSAAVRSAREEAIISREKAVAKDQEDIFGQEGTLMKRRVEMIKPIQDRVFKVISDYANLHGFGMVLDIATNTSILYYSPKVDKTEEIIKLVK